MEQCEVLIVGAGPAGSTCARILAQAGLSVMIMDRDRFPRDKPCAGWITPSVFRTLGIDPEIYRRQHLLQDIRQFRTALMYGDELVTDYDETVSYGIRRAEFDHFLLRQSKAELLTGEAVTRLEKVADGWLVNGSVKARLLIGAGGHNCPVARTLGAVPGKERPIAAMVAELELSERQWNRLPQLPGHVTLCFTRDLNGYGWLLRKGNLLNVGLGLLGGGDVRSQATNFLGYLRRRDELNEDVVPLLKGHAYLPYRSSGGRKLSGEGALLIGDAAGMSYPESGEGILPAIESAVIAAQTVLRAGGDYRERRLAAYDAAVAGRFGGKATGALTLQLPAVLKRMGGATVLSNGWLTRHVVLDRWFLHRGEPALDGEQVVSQALEGLLPA